MRKILKLSTLLLFFAISFSACEKYAENKNTPPAIKKLIKQYDKSGAEIFSIIEYNCCETIIYCFEEHRRDGHCHYIYTHFYDKDGHLLCSDGTYRMPNHNWHYNECEKEYADCEETRIIRDRFITG